MSDLSSAVFLGLTTTVKHLLRSGMDPNVGNNQGETPLHIACMESHHDIIVLLIKYQANPNSKDNCGVTPLHWAIKRKKFVTIKFLLDHGANPYTSNNYGNLPLDWVGRVPTWCDTDTSYYYVRDFLVQNMKEKAMAKFYGLGRLFQQRSCGILVGARILRMMCGK